MNTIRGIFDIDAVGRGGWLQATRSEATTTTTDVDRQRSGMGSGFRP